MNSLQSKLIRLIRQHDGLTPEEMKIVLLRSLEILQKAKDDRTTINKAVDEAAKNPIS